MECVRTNPNASTLSEMLRGARNWPLLWGLAEQHGVMPQLAACLRDVDGNLLPPEVQENLRDWDREHALFTLSLIAELFRILEAFAEAKIEVLVTKGPVLAQRCYGDPGMRQYGDLDLIVRDRDIGRTTEMMLELGYEPRIPLGAIAAQKIPGEYVFCRAGTNLLVEFHTEHTFRYHPRKLQLDKLFERQSRVRFDEHEVPTLSSEDELVLICIHSAKHFWEQLSWFADVGALISRKPGVDWTRVTSAAREVGAERMLHVGLQLARNMLGVTLPPEIEAEVCADAGALSMAAQIASRMPSRDSTRLGLFHRAVFRIRMRGDFFTGVAYLLRLLFSTTEEDWSANPQEKRHWLLEALGRPVRLMRKYGHHAKG